MTDDSLHRTHPVIRQRARELRQEMTPAERLLWQRLRRRQLADFYFRRQHPLGHFLVDFCCLEAGLVVEVDGDVHATQQEYDAARTEWLEQRGFQVIRFTNEDVYRRMDAVLEQIVDACRQGAAKAGARFQSE